MIRCFKKAMDDDTMAMDDVLKKSMDDGRWYDVLKKRWTMIRCFKKAMDDDTMAMDDVLKKSMDDGRWYDGDEAMVHRSFVIVPSCIVIVSSSIAIVPSSIVHRLF